MPRFKYKYLLIPLGVFLIVYMSFLLSHLSDGGISLPFGKEKAYPFSAYVQCEGVVYYNKPFRGYFLVKADVNTFQPFSHSNEEVLAGRDKDHVFFKTAIIPGLHPEQAVYLGGNYCKGPQQVFYGTTLLEEAEVASFKWLQRYYAADKHHVYYKGKIIKEADVQTVHPVLDEDKRSDDAYLSDKNYVYYNGNRIEGAAPDSFTTLYVKDDQWQMKYAFDGKHYFYKDDMILIDHDETKSAHLKLLTADKGFTWNAIFYQDNAIYSYDTDKRILLPLCNRHSTAPLVEVNRGIFKDDEHVYFTFSKLGWNAKERARGYTTGFVLAGQASATDFKQIGKFEPEGHSDDEGVIYQSGTVRYFHTVYAGNGNYHPGLRLFYSDGTIDDLPVDPACTNFFEVSNSPFKDLWRVFKKDVDHNDD